MGNDYSYNISTLADGSCLITGTFEGNNTTFGAGEAHPVSLNSNGLSDIFVAKYNSDGTLAWAKQAGGPGSDESNGISALADGSCIITGTYQMSPTFGAGEAHPVTLSWVGNKDVFIAKYNPDGTLAWAKQAGGTKNDVVYGISTLADGSCLITGNFYGTATFGDGEAHPVPLTSVGYSDIFIAKYNSDGTLAWAKRAGGDLDDQASSISTLADGSCLVTGFFSLVATFGFGEASPASLTSVGSKDIFIAKFNSNGTLAWATQAGGTANDEGCGISTLADGSCLVIGVFENEAVFGENEPQRIPLTSTGKSDVFIARFNADGTHAWAKRAGGAEADWGRSISTLADGSCLITGNFAGTATFGAGEASPIALDSAGSSDIFIARYNPNGTFAWAKRSGGTESDEGGDISPLTDGSCLMTGIFAANATFGAGEASPIALNSDGSSDIFIARCNSNGSFTPLP